MYSSKLKLKMLIESLKSTFRDWDTVCKGQKPSAELLQLSHRLEKGLVNDNPKHLWGWDKAKRIKQLVDSHSDLEEAKIGSGVLHAFLSKKRESQDIKELQEAYRLDTSENENNSNEGGVVNIEKISLEESEKNILKLFFKSRHSIRNFNGTPVDTNLLEESIQFAMMCPSACNRQPYHVYVVEGNHKKEHISNNESINPDKVLYITGDISSYTPDEFNDWYISTSIFVGYLTLALHMNGIGSCIMRKDLVIETEYNKKVRSFCKIPTTEKLVIEIVIGNYNNGIIVPMSRRKKLQNIVTYVK